MVKYVVTGYVIHWAGKPVGKRDTISKPMSLAEARAFKKQKDAEMKTATPKYRWVKTTEVEKVVSPSKTTMLKCIGSEIGRKLPSDPDEIRRVFYTAFDKCTVD